MDTKAVIVIMIAAVVIFLVDLSKGRMKGALSGGGAHHPTGEMTWTRGQVVRGWAIMLILTNVFGLIGAACSRWIAINEYNALWLMAIYIGWFASLGLIARPIAFPKNYRSYWDTQDDAAPGTIMLAPFILFWMAAMVAVSWSFLTDLG